MDLWKHFAAGQLSRFEAYIFVFAAMIIALSYSDKSDYTVRRISLLTLTLRRTAFDLGV